MKNRANNLFGRRKSNILLHFKGQHRLVLSGTLLQLSIAVVVRMVA
jgi:hypothetical protein